MATESASNLHVIKTASALSAWVRVDLDSSGELEAAGADGRCIGILQHDAASAEYATVKGLPSYLAKAAVAITIASEIYPASSGKVTGISTTLLSLGRNRQAATAAGDIIEIIPFISTAYVP